MKNNEKISTFQALKVLLDNNKYTVDVEENERSITFTYTFFSKPIIPENINLNFALRH